MKIVFIAGPYFGDGTYETIEKNIRHAEIYQIELANHRVGFFCAHNHTEQFQASGNKGARAPEEFYYELDWQFLTRVAEAILALPGWEKSKGAVREIDWAKEHQVPIFYPKDPTDIDDIVAWAHDDKK